VRAVTRRHNPGKIVPWSACRVWRGRPPVAGFWVASPAKAKDGTATLNESDQGIGVRHPRRGGGKGGGRRDHKFSFRPSEIRFVSVFCRR